MVRLRRIQPTSRCLLLDSEGEPLSQYLEAVRPRFGRWIVDTCRRPHDESWLAYQEEVARRHTREGKNTTDGVESVDYIPLRYIIAFVYPITATIRDFLAKDGVDDAEVDVMYQAWFKSVVLQVALWARPYSGESW